MFRAGQTLEDLLVQARFLFSTRCNPRPSSASKKSWNCFWRDDRNERLQGLFEARTGGRRKIPACKAGRSGECDRGSAVRNVAYAPNAARLAKFRNQSERFPANLRLARCFSVAVNEVEPSRATRCIAVVGSPASPSDASDFVRRCRVSGEEISYG